MTVEVVSELLGDDDQIIKHFKSILKPRYHLDLCPIPITTLNHFIIEIYDPVF